MKFKYILLDHQPQGQLYFLKTLGTWYIEVHRNLYIYGALIYKILINLQVWGIATFIIQKRFQCPCVGNSKVNFGTNIWYQNRNTLT